MVYLGIYFSCQSNELCRTFNQWRTDVCISVTSQPGATAVLEKMGADLRFWLVRKRQWKTVRGHDLYISSLQNGEIDSFFSSHNVSLSILLPMVLSHKTAHIKLSFQDHALLKTTRRDIGQRSVEMWLKTSPGKPGISILRELTVFSIEECPKW